jgi:hypothetical protein
MALGVLTLVSLLISLVLQLLGEERLEWVDVDGFGNGIVHQVCDDNGWPVVYLRLSDYANTNNVYLLEILNTNLYVVKNNIKAIRYDQQGKRLSESEFQANSRDGSKVGMKIELPLDFTPRVVGETLVLKLFVVSRGGDVNEMKIKFSSKKFYYPLSL